MTRIRSVFGWAMALALLAGCALTEPAPVRKSSAPDPGAVNVDAAIRKGDTILIRVTGILPEINQQEEVNEFGMISLPYIKEIRAEGLTPGVLARKIERAYLDGGYYTKLSVSVTPGQRELYLRGEVRVPGRYPWTSGLTVLKAISLSGGFSDYADRSDIEIRRGDKVIRVNSKQAEKDPQKDVEVYPRDDIRVGRTIW